MTVDTMPLSLLQKKVINNERNRNKRIQEYKEKSTNTYKKETQIEEEVKPQTSQIDQNLLDELKKAFGD